jgi:hypothetical protein
MKHQQKKLMKQKRRNACATAKKTLLQQHKHA